MENDLPTYKYNIDEEHEDIDTFDSVRDSKISSEDKYKIAFVIAATIAILLAILTVLSFTVFNKNNNQQSQGTGESQTIVPSTVTVTESAQQSSQNVEPSISTIVETQVMTETITETRRREVIVNGNSSQSPVVQEDVPPNYIGDDISTDDSAQTEPGP